MPKFLIELSKTPKAREWIKRITDDFENMESHDIGKDFIVGKKEMNKKTMDLKIAVRKETDDDAAAITEVTIAAFKTLEISSHTEQFIIKALRAHKALTVSLVTEVAGRIVG